MNITDYPITSKFHEIDRVHSSPHSGLDLATPYGTQIKSQDSAIVSVTYDKWLGDAVRLKLENGDIIVYGHLSRVNVVNGQHIEVNQLIGLSGGIPNSNQGKSTAPHVHISQYHNNMLIDPYNYLFHHQNIQNNNSSSFALPMMLILLLFITWKFRRAFVYSIAILLTILTIFIVS